MTAEPINMTEAWHEAIAEVARLEVRVDALEAETSHLAAAQNRIRELEDIIRTIGIHAERSIQAMETSHHHDCADRIDRIRALVIDTGVTLSKSKQS